MLNCNPTWEKLYQQGRHILHYPYDFVVVFVNRHLPSDKPRDRLKILEIGCGAGNNLWFAAREGFSVTGIDASPSAIEYARQRFAKEELNGDFHLGDFTQLPFEDNSFDLVVERAAIVCCGLSVGQQAVDEVRRVLHPQGRFLFNPYSTKHTSYKHSQTGKDNTRVNVIGGNLQGIGQLCFYDLQMIEQVLFSGWKILTLEHLEKIDYANPELPVHAEWQVIAEKQ